MVVQAEIREEPRPVVILVAEDDVLVRMMTNDVLTDAGYRVHEAVNAEEALRVLEVRPDVRLLISDVNMGPGLDGFALARIVDLRWPGLRTVVVSGHMTPSLGDLPKDVRFLAKPVAPSRLLDEVRQVLDEADRADWRPGGSPESQIEIAPATGPQDMLIQVVPATGPQDMPIQVVPATGPQDMPIQVAPVTNPESMPIQVAAVPVAAEEPSPSGSLATPLAEPDKT